MHWHYRLGHVSFPKLKQLALSGEIPMKLAKIVLPKCAGCLFGTMTKLSWQGKEAKSSHKVFIATKLGGCDSVNLMMSKEVDFYMQLKGNLPRSATNAPPSLLIASVAYALSTSNSTHHQKKQWPP
jgi:hypothetical protein